MPLSLADQLDKLPPTVRPIVVAARRLVKDVAPKADEIAYQGDQPRSSTYMWKLARYAISGENVAGIGTFPRHSAIFFYRGRELDDPDGLLEGSGKDSRFVRLGSVPDVRRPAVKRLLQQAFRLAR